MEWPKALAIPLHDIISRNSEETFMHDRRWRGLLLSAVWTLAGGPVFRYHESTRASSAPRSLGDGYAVRASLAVVF